MIMQKNQLSIDQIGFAIDGLLSKNKNTIIDSADEWLRIMSSSELKELMLGNKNLLEKLKQAFKHLSEIAEVFGVLCILQSVLLENLIELGEFDPRLLSLIHGAFDKEVIMNTCAIFTNPQKIKKAEISRLMESVYDFQSREFKWIKNAEPIDFALLLYTDTSAAFVLISKTNISPPLMRAIEKCRNALNKYFLTLCDHLDGEQDKPIAFQTETKFTWRFNSISHILSVFYSVPQWKLVFSSSEQFVMRLLSASRILIDRMESSHPWVASTLRSCLTVIANISHFQYQSIAEQVRGVGITAVFEMYHAFDNGVPVEAFCTQEGHVSASTAYDIRLLLLCILFNFVEGDESNRKALRIAIDILVNSFMAQLPHEVRKSMESKSNTPVDFEWNMENLTLAGHVCLLLGYLAIDNDEAAQKIRDLLPWKSFHTITVVLQAHKQFQENAGVLSPEVDKLILSTVAKLQRLDVANVTSKRETTKREANPQASQTSIENPTQTSQDTNVDDSTGTPSPPKKSRGPTRKSVRHAQR